jgi:uncharacterized protein YbjT (DUF2867 family)
MPKILVIGATGNTGSILVPSLIKAGQEVRAFVRNEKKAQPLKDAGAEIYIGDLDKSATVDGALHGIEKVYLCTWNGSTASAQGKNVIEAIQRVGTNPYVVRHSAFGSKGSRIIQQTNEVDDALKESGLSWSIIKPTFFMQNLMMAVQTIKSEGNIYWDWSNGKVGMIDVRDVASSALGALIANAEKEKEYVLTGPQAISMHDVADSFTRILGKKINYIAVPHEASKETMMRIGFPEFIVDGYIELNVGFAQNVANMATDNVKVLSGNAPRSINNFISDFKNIFSA